MFKKRHLLIWALTITALIFCSSALSAEWNVISEKSYIKFEATYDSIPFDGEFGKYYVSITFDEKELQKAKFMAVIDTTSVNTNSSQRDEALAEADWFNFKQFPTATFETRSIEKKESNSYLAKGTLTIKSIKRVIELPFTWLTNGDQVTAEGKVSLNRNDFNIGEGDWKEDDTIGFDVVVKIKLLLRQKH